MTSSGITLGDAAPEEFYDSSPLEPDQLYQGEILVNVPILNMPKPTRWLLLRTKSGRRVHDALANGTVPGLVNVLDSNQSGELWYSDGLGDFAMAQLDKRPVLVLSQTCDVQNKDFIQVAPILPARASGGDETDLANLKSGQILNAFWLMPYLPHIPIDSFADLTLIQAVHRSYMRRIQPDQHFRLSPGRTRLLQQSITRYFGRPNSFNSRSDLTPKTGTYLCASCFYFDGTVTAVNLNERDAFPECQSCGRGNWILRGR